MLKISSLFILVFLFSCTLTQAQAKKEVPKGWIFISLTEDKAYELYVNHEFIEKEDDKIKTLVRFYPGEEKRLQIKKEFEEVNREVKKDFGYVPDNWEALLEKAYEGISLHYVFLIDCKGTDIEVAGTPFRMTIKKDSPQEKIYKYVCKTLEASEGVTQ